MGKYALAAALLLVLSGCSTFTQVHKDLKVEVERVDDQYDCRGFELSEGAALCINKVSITITIPF